MIAIIQISYFHPNKMGINPNDSQSFLPQDSHQSSASYHGQPDDYINNKQTSYKKHSYYWNDRQNKTYLKFLKLNIQLLTRQNLDKRREKINLKLSKFLRTRTPVQCHTHHQKMRKKYGTILNIITVLSEKYDSTPDQEQIVKDQRCKVKSSKKDMENDQKGNITLIKQQLCNDQICYPTFVKKQSVNHQQFYTTPIQKEQSNEKQQFPTFTKQELPIQYILNPIPVKIERIYNKQVKLQVRLQCQDAQYIYY